MKYEATTPWKNYLMNFCWNHGKYANKSDRACMKSRRNSWTNNSEETKHKDRRTNRTMMGRQNKGTLNDIRSKEQKVICKIQERMVVVYCCSN